MNAWNPAAQWPIAQAILESTRSIAVVGASPHPERDSYRIMAYLQAAGFSVFPVNPTVAAVLGEPCVARLGELNEPVDTVVCFRRSDVMLPVAEEAIETGARHLWMQLGVVNDAAWRLAVDAGMSVVMDRCIMVDHQQWRALGAATGR